MNTVDGRYVPRHAKPTVEKRNQSVASMVEARYVLRDVLRKEAAESRDALCMVIVLYIPRLAQAIKVLLEERVLFRAR